jgi:hypothetical protein
MGAGRATRRNHMFFDAMQNVTDRSRENDLTLDSWELE